MARKVRDRKLEEARQAMDERRAALESDKSALEKVKQRLAEAGGKREALLEERRGLLVAANVDGDPEALARLREQEAELHAARLELEDATGTAEQLAARIRQREEALEAAERTLAGEEYRRACAQRQASVNAIDRAIRSLVEALQNDARLAGEQAAIARRAGVGGFDFDGELVLRNAIALRLRGAGIGLEHADPRWGAPLTELMSYLTTPPPEREEAA